MRKVKLVQGVGVNDSDYVLSQNVGGKVVYCPFHQRWVGMFKRCYSNKYQKGKPTYSGCTVAPEWHSFMDFKVWMETQDWEGKQLDKDILVEGNKVYSPSTCAFVTPAVNAFVLDSMASRGEYPLGVCYHKRDKVYQSNISVSGKGRAYLGSFKTPEEAHQAWRVAKYELAVQISSEQTDPRVAEALIKRYKL